MGNGKNAVVLLRGGVDSTTALAIAIDEGFVPFALSVRYGKCDSCLLGAKSFAELGTLDPVVAAHQGA